MLKSLLAKFLKGEDMGKCPQLETKIVSFSPLQITDDAQRFIDLSSLEDRVTEELEGKTNVDYLLVLQEWKFVLRRIPNSQEYFFDLSVNKYKLSEDKNPRPADQDLIKMEDDEEIHYLFEARKRQEIEKMVRTSKDTSQKEASSRKSPAKAGKDTIGKEETALPSTKISEVKHLVPGATSEELKAALHQKPSAVKTEGKKSPLYTESSFFRKAGIVSANTKYSAEDELYLTIADIMSVMPFIPQVKRSVIRAMPPIRHRRSPSSDSQQDDSKRESQAKVPGQRSSQDSRSSRSKLEFEDVRTLLRTGGLKWDQIVFKKSAYEHLKLNQQMLEVLD